MTLKAIPADRAKELVEGGALPRPLSTLQTLDVEPGRPIIFTCRSGARTTAHADRLAAAAPSEAYRLEGGLDSWKKAGHPVVADRRQPIEMMRQVQIVAGS